MEILDGKRHDEEARRGQLNRIVSFLNGGKHWGFLEHPSNALNLSSEQIQLADEVFAKTLRALVDQWIDSGKDANGIESMLARSVRRVPLGYTDSLYDILLAWLGRHMPQPVLMNSGKIGIIAGPPDLRELDENGLVTYRPENYAKECAIFYLKELLDLPGAHRLARCNNQKCRRYYVRQRLRKAEIKRGAFCGECGGVGSMVRTMVSRQAHKQKLVNSAAEIWDQWKPTARYGKQSDWIAKRINKGSVAPITGKWVTQNRKAIELEVERRKRSNG